MDDVGSPEAATFFFVVVVVVVVVVVARLRLAAVDFDDDDDDVRLGVTFPVFGVPVFLLAGVRFVVAGGEGTTATALAMGVAATGAAAVEEGTVKVSCSKVVGR